MAIQTRRVSVEEFDRFVALPENAERLFEYIGGEVVEVVSNQRSSRIAARIIGFLFAYLQQHNLGFLTSSDGGYQIAGERYIPDVAYVSRARQTEPSDQSYSPIPPDLVVEVLSPSNTPHEIRLKMVNYLAAGCTVWIVDPDRQVVEVYTPGRAGKTVHVDETLDGGEVLPGFTLAVKDIFAA